MQSHKGFTLLEVMVALFIVATTLVTIVQSISANTQNATTLKSKSLAALIANNQLIKTRIADNWPRVSQTKGEVTEANQDWFWTQKVSATDDPLLRRIDISVGLVEDKKTNIFNLTGFMSAPK